MFASVVNNRNYSCQTRISYLNSYDTYTTMSRTGVLHMYHNNDRQHTMITSWYKMWCSKTGNCAAYSGSHAMAQARYYIYGICVWLYYVQVNILTKYLHILHAYSTWKKSKTSLTCITARINITYMITSHQKKEKNPTEKTIYGSSGVSTSLLYTQHRRNVGYYDKLVIK